MSDDDKDVEDFGRNAYCRLTIVFCIAACDGQLSHDRDTRSLLVAPCTLGLYFPQVL